MPLTLASVRTVGAALRSHWFGTVVATVGTLVFFVGSLFEPEIRGAWPFYWGPFTAVSWRAVVFWIGVAIVTVLAALKNKADDDARAELVRATEDVKQLVQTLPPRGWREDYAAAIDAAADGLAVVLPRASEPDVTREELAKVIRQLLNSIATLAYQYDARPRTSAGPVEYSANVMTFVQRSGAGTTSDPFFSEHVMKAVRFFPAGQSLDSLDGMLYLQPQLTYTTRTEGLDELPALALPIPSTPRSANGRWRVLPGAPLAFVKDGVDGYSNVATIGAWFDHSGDFPRSVRDEVVAYFEEPGARMRSFLSRRLRSTSGERLGVLNIHAGRANLLGVLDSGVSTEASAARQDEFLALMTPLLRELENAVEFFRISRNQVS